MRRMLTLCTTTILFAAAHLAAAAPALNVIKGEDLLTHEKVDLATDSDHGLVVVFLSAGCPCSDSHVGELAALAKEYPKFHFVAVHSNSDESKDTTLHYFGEKKLPFPVLQDKDAKWADAYKAFKTPHAFVLNQKGEVAYEGGVSDSHEFERAKHKFLREALADLTAGRPVATSKGRTLGCVISRGANVW